MFVCPECGESVPAAGPCPRDGVETAAADDPMLGRTIGQFRIARLIGEGGMGRVYRAVQPAIGGRLAIKFLSEARAGDPKQVERFFAEARAVNLIRHENIVNVVDLATLDGRPYITMEYLDGAPLSAIIARSGPLPLGGLVRLLIEVLDALAAAHARGIVHRDLKPDNVFVTPRGHAKVLDFGIAKLSASEGGSTTTGGFVVGTPAYVAPEQARGQRCDGRADLYALGIMLFEGATGQRPFEATSTFEILHQHVYVAPPPPRSRRPDLPEALERIVLRAIEKEPSARFASAEEMAAALDEACAALPRDSFANLCALPATSAPSPSPKTPAAVEPSVATLDPPLTATLGTTPGVALRPDFDHARTDPARARSGSGRRAFAILATGAAALALAGAWVLTRGPSGEIAPSPGGAAHSGAVEPPTAPSPSAMTAPPPAASSAITAPDTGPAPESKKTTTSKKPKPAVVETAPVGSASAAVVGTTSAAPSTSASGKPRKDVF